MRRIAARLASLELSRPSRPPRRNVDGILLLDKPLGLSSNTALQEVRRLFRAEKAGHTGSLDPLATGLLPICLGEGTKLSGALLDSDKRYTATARIGYSTTTGDAEGDPVESSDPDALDPARLPMACEALTGPILQVPPMYSALKHEGRRLYQIARAGGEVERTARPVVIHEMRLITHTRDEWVLDVRCSKGTYIRTLIEDLAASVGQRAHLSALRRTEVDPFDGRAMRTLDSLVALGEGGTGALDSALLPLASAVRGWNRVQLAHDQLSRVARGQAIPIPEGLPVGNIAVLDESGRLLALAAADPQGRLAPWRWLGGANFA